MILGYIVYKTNFRTFGSLEYFALQTLPIDSLYKFYQFGDKILSNSLKSRTKKLTIIKNDNRDCHNLARDGRINALLSTTTNYVQLRVRLCKENKKDYFGQ